MKMTRNNIILNGLMVVALLASSGCWTNHGNQPGGGQVGGSVRSSDRPTKTSGAFASDNTNDHGSGQGAQLAVSGSGNLVVPLNP